MWVVILGLISQVENFSKLQEELESERRGHEETIRDAEATHQELQELRMAAADKGHDDATSIQSKVGLSLLFV